MCKEVNVHQNCLVASSIQNIFCLPQAKEIHQALELFFGLTIPLSANPTPQTISLADSIRQTPVRRASDV